jgi:hypothetical protein
MAQGVLSPLQLAGGAGLLQNTGIAVNSEFLAKITEYEDISFIADLLTTMSLSSAAGLSSGTIASLRTLGSVTCPALGDSIPNGFAGVAPIPAPSNAGFVSIFPAIGATYLGSGDVGKFAQAFAAAQGYVGLVNQFIISAANANEYLGPTFTNLDDMITGDLSKVSLALPALGEDLEQLGFLISLADLDHLGEPAALLQQLSKLGNMGNSTLPCVQAALEMSGLTTADITNLISNNRESLFNPAGLTTNQFDRLQQRAYQGMNMVSGACLDDVLAILDVTTPGINDMADLLDPVKILPTSYPSLQFEDQLIYTPTGDVTSGIADTLNATTPTGCDELGKIIPPNQAVANKALQFQLQQVSGIQNLTLPQLAAILV